MTMKTSICTLLPTLLAAVAPCAPTAVAFTVPTAAPSLSRWGALSRLSIPPALLATVNDETDTAQLLEEIRSMRVKELKSELAARSIDTRDAFEKEELVKRLFEARKTVASPAVAKQTATSSAPSGGSSGKSAPGVLSAPLAFLSLDNFRSVAASNADVFVRPSAGQFATLTFDLPTSSRTNGDKKISLLVDTACSGVVLRPSSVREHGLRTFRGPGAMTAAGGTAGSTSFATLDNLTLCGRRFGTLPAAVQDIGALPNALDGIVGLSFLSQFACVEFDFRDGRLNLYDSERTPPGPEGGISVVAEADMRLTSIGIYVADVTLDGRGPVRMLVDTGAASTLLNWRGVSDMGLSLDSSLIGRNTDAIGAIGADNVALHLTHRYVLGRRFGFDMATGNYSAGVDLNGGMVNIDIGDIPVLDVLKRDGVGGILGADLLMQCDVVRISNMKGGMPKVILYK